MNAETIRTRFEKRADEIRNVVDEKVTNLRQRREDIQHKGEEAVSAARGRIRNLEAETLEGALELLGKARNTLGDRATVLSKGEDALSELLISVRAGQAETLPIANFDDLSIKKVRPFLDGLAMIDLRALHAYESSNKNRVTLLKELDERISAANLEVLAA
jgi:hypothetical protein